MPFDIMADPNQSEIADLSSNNDDKRAEESRTELAMADLLDNTEQILPAAYNQGKPSRFNMTGLKWDYTPFMKKIDSAVDVIGPDGKVFKTIIQYYGVSDPKHVGSIDNPVRVGCKCSEYVDNFLKANREQDVHTGFAPKNQPEPKKNPLRIAGLCRHLVALYHLQVQAGYVQEQV